MENLTSRYRNVTILAAVLSVQVLGLAVQVKRSTENQSSRLIRIWAVDAVTPVEKVIVWFQKGTSDLWHGYIYLRGVRQENRDLKAEIERLRLEQVRLSGDAEQAHRLQALLSFKEQFISRTLAAQVIGSSGSEQSRSIYIDKGARDGIAKDMAVLTADGVVGKVLQVFNTTAQVLLINDQTSGVGAILEKSRLQGVLRGTPAGEVILEKVMADEQVDQGERALTSGGDQIFPKGLPVGIVTRVSKGNDLFLNIRVRPFSNLSKLEEVLVITQREEKVPRVAENAPVRAVDILAQRLPSVPEKPPQDPNKPSAAAGAKTNPEPATKPAKPQIAGGANPQQQTNGAVSASGPAGPTNPKSHLAATADKPATNASVAPKAASNPAMLKPATGLKSTPPATKVSEQPTKPEATAPGPNPVQIPAETPPPEDKPQ